MKILNIRLGLATNSSSSHSLIFLPRGVSASAIDPSNGEQSYGWDYFQLVTADAKRDYLAASLYQQLRHEMGEDIAETVTRSWVVGTNITREAYVDHQSEWTFPRQWDGKGLDRAFFDDFEAYLMRDDLVIAGGNDNDDGAADALDLPGATMIDTLPTECYSMVWVARKDGDYWTLFNRESGAKIRLTFNNTEMPKRSHAPELIDIKITDYCPFDCAYCYQDSTKEGKHGDKGWISSLAWQLSDLKVFEVALGGGEPTLHPDFVDILAAFRMRGIVPNFTTKSLGWLKDKKQRDAIFKHAGAFAYSVEKAADVKDLVATLKKNQVEFVGCYTGARKVTVQHVVGVAEESDFRDLLLTCAKNYLPITLLGFKEVGRGPSFGKKASSKWLDIVAEICNKHYLQIGIDTALADKHWDALLAAGVKENCMTRKEGQFSCYVDAVAKTLNVSSYTDKPGTPIKSSYGGGASAHDFGTMYRALAHE